MIFTPARETPVESETRRCSSCGAASLSVLYRLARLERFLLVLTSVQVQGLGLQSHRVVGLGFSWTWLEPRNRGFELLLLSGVFEGWCGFPVKDGLSRLPCSSSLRLRSLRLVSQYSHILYVLLLLHHGGLHHQARTIMVLILSLYTDDNNKSDPRRSVLLPPSAIATMSITTSSSQAPANQIQRRRTFLSIALAQPLLCKPAAASAVETPFSSSPAESLTLPVGLLESRVDENVLAPPPYGMERPDISYPAWFQGTWKVVSTTASVEAPCGVDLFGSNATYAAAQKEVGTTLNYDCRFVPPSSSGGNGDATVLIADREFNVRSIAQAALGAYSVLDIPLAGPNKLTAILSPVGSPRPLQVDLLTVRRRQEEPPDNDRRFDCSEVVREIVAAPGGGSSSAAAAAAPPVLKEIETTSLYRYDPTTNSIRCRQRSATFLLPSQSNPVLLRRWELARGRPVDVRFYNVVYKKKK